MTGEKRQNSTQEKVTRSKIFICKRARSEYIFALVSIQQYVEFVAFPENEVTFLEPCLQPNQKCKIGYTAFRKSGIWTKKIIHMNSEMIQ
jgi:hypothetical protein